MVLKNFIVFEGIDGSGTTTQLKLLKAKCPTIALTAEPTASATGQLLRRVLSGEVDVSKQTVAHLFAADRCEHLFGKSTFHEGRLDTGVAEACAAGSLVVSDRYLFSSLAYQGEATVRDLTAQLNEPFPLPEALVYFAISPQAALERVASRGLKREIYETLSTLKEVSRRYDELLTEYTLTPKGEGMSVIKVDAALPIQEVAATVWQAVSPFLGPHQIPL